MSINARPHINGNPAVHFSRDGLGLKVAIAKLEEKAKSMDCFHGRNYQHLETSEALDKQREDVDRLWTAIGDLRQLAHDIIEAGK